MVESLDLPFDAVADTAVRALWDRLEEAGVPTLRTYTHRRHRPHVSLLVADSIDLAAAGEALAPLDLGDPVALELVGPGLFPGDPAVLYLTVAPTSGLLELHRRVLGAVRPATHGVWPHYALGRWVPHCTVAMAVALDAIEPAVEACLAGPLPIVATSTAIDRFEARSGRATTLVTLGA